MRTPERDQPSTDNGLQILGLCRFSVPSTGGFQVSHESIEERRAFLYDPARLEQRFAWFEKVTLPALAAQQNKAFKLIVMMGEDFPDPWRSRLEAHIARIPQLVGYDAPPLHHRKICSDAILGHIDPNAEAVAQFRMDDDDAVSSDFTVRLRRDHRQIKPLVRNRDHVALEYGKGIEIRVEKGEVRFTPLLTRFWSAGLVVFTRPDDGRHVLEYQMQHNKLWMKMSAVSHVDRFMFVRGEHGGNDSQIALGSHKLDHDEVRVRQILQARFEIDPEDIIANRALLEG